MKRKISKFNKEKNLVNLLKQFVKFGIVGAINTILSYAIMNIGYYIFNIHEQICNIIAFIITVFISFLLNNKFVFKENAENRSWIKSLIKVYIEEQILGIEHYIATLMNLVITIPINFILNKLWAFKSEKN